MKNLFAYDFTTNTIVASKATLKKAGNPTTPEYKALMKMIAEQPTFKVVEKTINTKSGKTTYKGLTIEMIHIEIMPPQDAIWQMRRKYGGVARKQAIPEQNVFYLDTWDTLNAYATAKVEADMDEFISSNNPEAQESIE